MAYVYEHRRLDTDEIFYIGIGINKHRCSSKNRRNKYWHNIVNKYGYSFKIIYDNLEWEDAVEFEKFLICLYGRKDLNTGCLCNMTDGGEGTLNRKHTEEAKLKISKKNTGNPSPLKGVAMSDETKRKLSLSKKGKSVYKSRKTIIDTNTGKTYLGIKEVLENYPEMKESTMYSYLNGHRPNKTSLEYLQ